MQFKTSPIIAERLRRYGGYTYLASPITQYPAGQKAAAEHAGRFAVDLMLQNVVVFCPAMHGHMACRFDDLGKKFTHDDWMRQCAPLVTAARVLAVLMLPTWDESRGVRQEITWAKARDIPVVYLPTTEN